MTATLALVVDAVRLLTPSDGDFPVAPHEVTVEYRMERGGAIWLNRVRMVPLVAAS